MDADGAEAEGEITIAVTPENDPPFAASDLAAAVGGQTATINVLANDEDIDGDTLRVGDISRPRVGDITSDGTRLSYTPPADASGPVSLTYTAVDPDGASSQAEVTISVIEGASQPVAADDSVAVREDGGRQRLDVVGNDRDPDGEMSAHTVRLVDAPSRGDVSVDGTAVSYRPAADAVGTELFTYELCDPTGLCDSAAVGIRIAPVNDPPSFSAGLNPEAAEDEGPVIVEDWASDRRTGPSNESGQSLLFETRSSNPSLFVDQPSVDGDGDLKFTARANAFGTAAITVRAVDSGGTADGGDDTSEWETAVITVTAVNDAPVAIDDAGTVVEDDPAGVTVDVLVNDSDIEGDALAVSGFDDSALTLGSVADNGDGTFTYIPDPNVNGTDAFTYDVADGNGGSDTATVTITVTAVNDAPVASDDVGAVDEDDPAGVTVDVLANDTDIDGDALTVAGYDDSGLTLGSVADNGDGTFTYIPNPDANGTDAFTYDVADGNGGSDTAAVTITVTAVNDAPVASDDVGAVVEDDPAGVTVDVLVNDSDIEGDALTVAGYDDSGLTLGSVVDNGDGTFTYIPNPDANGTDVFTYDVADGNGGSDTATVAIAVTPMPDAPVAVDDAGAVDEDDPAGVTVDVLVNDSDVDGDALTVAGYDDSGLTLGSVADNGDGTFTYIPDPNANGTDVFTYDVTDGNGGSDTATVVIAVTPMPDAPVANDNAYLTPDDTPLVVPAPGLLANDFDLDGDALSHSLIPVELPSNGLVVLSAIGDGGFVYTPAAGFVGTDTFSYRVNDGTGLSAVAEVSITVDATVISQRLFLGTSFNAGAWEFAGGPLPVADPEPDHNLSGDPGFELKKGDGKEDQDTPEKNLYWTYDVVGAPLSLHGPVNLELWATSKDFDDKDEARLHVRLYDCAADGSDCQLLTDSERYYEEFNNEVADWVRKDIAVGAVNRSIPVGRQLRLRLQVEKDDLWIAASGDRPSQLHITADIIPEPPVANQDAYATPGDTPLVVAAPGLLANDYDPDGDSLMVSTVPEVDPSDGSVTLGADGSFTYTPDTGFGGTDTFSYRLTDGRGLSAIGVVTVNVDSALLSQDFFLGTSLTGSTWGLLSAPLPAADPEPDHDASDDPGIFLDDGDGKETQSSADKNLYWTHDVVGSSLDLDGPVALELWATAKDFDANKKARPHVRVYDCAADGSDCQLLVETDVVYDPYNGGVADWVRKDINVGTVDHSVAVGRQLRMRLQVEHEELWIAASGDRPSRLRVTTGP